MALVPDWYWPLGQSVHDAALAAEYWPAEHATHVEIPDAPVEADAVPAGQPVHCDAASKEKKPAAQETQVDEDDALVAADAVPAKQLTQDVALTTVWYWPAKHPRQPAAPEETENQPTTHSTHVEDAVAPATADAKPAEQLTQDVALMAVWYWPAEQLVQLKEPEKEEN